MDVLFLNQYYSSRYMPVTNQFYFQEDATASDQLFLNLFLSFKIKQARVFVKYLNLMDKVNNVSSFTTQDYAVLNGGIRFGLKWIFYN